ncbi:hypothetical protein [Mycobacterium sp. C31M]
MTEPPSVAHPPKARMYAGSVELFYEESKAAREVMDKLLATYRTNTTTVLALATGAATFFGLSDSPKGIFFIFSMVAYGIGSLVAVTIYWPQAWRVNVAHDAAEGLVANEIVPMRMHWNLALGHQEAIGETIRLIDGKWGVAVKFRLLLLATASVVLLAGLNVYQASQQQPAPDEPTRVIIERE